MNGSSAATVALTSAPATTRRRAAARVALPASVSATAAIIAEHDQVVVRAAERVDHVQRVGADEQERLTGSSRAARAQRQVSASVPALASSAIELHPPQRARHAEQRRSG